MAMTNSYVLCSTFVGILCFAIIPEVLASTRAPYFIKEPTDTYVQRGKSAVLDCLVGGSLKAAITWRKNGIALRDLSQDDRRMIKPDGSLYFSKVNHDTAENSDEGAYQCEALTRNDMNLDFQILSRTARLLIAEISSKVAVTPSKLKVSFGDTSRFHCYVNDSTPKAVVKWRKLGENHFIESKGRFTITFDGALQIAESRFDDQGDYECTAENTVTETSHTSTLTASLEVITDSGFPRGPYVSVASVERKDIAGDIVILDCIANGFPKPKVTWLFDGLPVVLGSDYSVVGQNNLMIESVTEEHAGTYTCRAISRNGIGEATTKLEVHHPPLFIKKPDNVHAYVDSNALFECFADGIPKPVITWSRNGDVIEESLYNVIGDGYLLVKRLVLSDMGPYQCFAENHLGKIQATAELNVYMKGQPLPSLQTTTAPNTERAEKPISASVSDTKTAQNTASASYTTVEPETTVASESSTNLSMTTTSVATVVPVTESISDISTAQVTTAAPDSTPTTDSTVDVHSSAVPDPTVTSDTTKFSVMTDALQGSSAVPYTPSAMSTIASFGTSLYPVKTATNKIATNQDTTSIPNSTASSAEPKTLPSMETLDTTVAKPDLITLIHGTSGTPASTTVADSIPETTDAKKHPYSTAAKDTASTVEATNTETVTVANQFTTAIREVITTSDARELSHPPTREITAFPKATSDFTTEPEPDVTAPPVITTTPDVQHRGLKYELQPIVKEKTVREGSIKVIKCIATAIHKPDVDWYRNGKKLPTMKCSELNDVRCQGIPYEVYEEIKEHKFGGKSARTIKVLKIRSALYSRDQGEFECIATNGHAQPAKLIIDLNVLAPPRLIQKPDKVLSSSGKGSKVSCVVNKGNPLPTFKWEYQNAGCFTFNTSSCDPVESQWMPVPESLIMTPPNTPTKKSVVNVQGNQPTASFRCLASNKLGRDFHVIKLVRSVPLAFVKKPQNILMGYLGQKILINCSTNDQDATVSLLYRRHPFVAFVELKLEEKKLLKKGQAFELLNVGLRDSGFYACEAKNEANDKIRWPPGTGYLILNEEPLEFLNQPPVIIRGYLAQNLVINCSTNDQEATVSLLYKHHPLASFHELDLKQNKLSKKGKVFTLLNVERRDAGIYSCQANNRGGWNIRWPPGRGYLIPIRGGLPNHFVLRPKTPLTVRQGQQITITCESEGISETKLHWMKQTKKGDVSVPSNLVTVDKDRSTNKVRAFLKISNVQAEDAGVYKCVLRVFDKTDHKMISLYVREPLSFLVKPDVILHGYQAHSLTLNCSTNDRNATVSLYHRHHPLAPFRERKIDAKKVLLKGQVFTLLNLSLKDQGTYACEAKTEENESIRWPSTRGYLIVSQARIPDYFELKPANPIIVPKGGSTIVTCESEGVSEIQLQWKKGDVSNGNASIQDRMVSIVKDWSTNRVQAILRITNAQMEDSGVYQCVLRVFEKTSMKSVEITVSHN